MRIGSVYPNYFPTYVYNTNQISARSLNRIRPIPNDALESKIGYHHSESSENTNPLRPGESRDFAGIAASQMALGRMNAARLFG